MIKKAHLAFIFILLIFSVRGQNILGIDVSHYQGDINWELVVSDGKIFAFVKATEGISYNDPNFQIYIKAGSRAGLVMGAYHFARPDNNTPIDEANHFVSVAKAYIGAGFLPPALDLEDPDINTHLDQIFSSEQLTNWVQIWMNRVEELTGIKPVIYLNTNYTNYLQASLNNYALWIAKPNTSPEEEINDIGNWNNWRFKQYSWTGNVNGISGNVDLDSYHGNITDFNNMLKNIELKDKKLSNIYQIYPNPSKGSIRIRSKKSDNKPKKIELYTITGQLLQSISLLNIDEKELINLQLQNKGIYFIKIIGNKENIEIHKHIIY